MSHVTDHAFPLHTWAGHDSKHVKRLKFLKRHNLPGPEEICLNVGARLAGVFFSTASPGLREQLGLERGLSGPGGPVLLDPADVLRGKAVLSEPYPRRKGQAFTHQAIMEMGERIEEKQKTRERREVEAAVKAKEEEMVLRMCEETNAAVLKKQDEMEELYRIRLKGMRTQLIQDFRSFLGERDEYTCLLWEDKVRESLEVLRTSMAEEMELAATRSQNKAEKVCLFAKLRAHNEMAEELRQKVRDLKKKWSGMVERAKAGAEREREKTMRELEEEHGRRQTALEEEMRTKCELAVAKATQAYRNTTRQLEAQVSFLKAEKNALAKEIQCMEVQEKSWRFLSQELLKQFQEVISLALNENPIYTEHLTSLERLLQARLQVSRQDTNAFLQAGALQETEKVAEERTACNPSSDAAPVPPSLTQDSKAILRGTERVLEGSSPCISSVDTEPPGPSLLPPPSPARDFKVLGASEVLASPQDTKAILRGTERVLEGSSPCISSVDTEPLGPSILPPPSPARDFKVLGASEVLASPQDRISAILDALSKNPVLRRIIISQ